MITNEIKFKMWLQYLFDPRIFVSILPHADVRDVATSIMFPLSFSLPLATAFEVRRGETKLE
jgi:hypothetical protein